jgi:hypothetical protein
MRKPLLLGGGCDAVGHEPVGLAGAAARTRVIDRRRVSHSSSSNWVYVLLGLPRGRFVTLGLCYAGEPYTRSFAGTAGGMAGSSLASEQG